MVRQSIDIILQNQAPGGAFVASPNFATYRSCWFRDGSFVAYALDLAGEHAAAARCHAWAAAALNRRADLVARAIDKTQRRYHA